MNHLIYQSAERFILSRELFGMKLGLDNITEFLKSIGTPQDRFKSVHIAGTNGKGSTAAMLSSVFSAQGYKTGLYTSPHLVDFRERIKIDNEKISRAAVVAFIKKHSQIILTQNLTFFEVVTALALDYFAQSEVDVAVIETGLGGRLDATNVLTPHLTITTDIDLDHTEILGTTIREISKEKAGIIKPGYPHLIGMLPDESSKIITKRCNELGSDLFELSKSDFKTDANKMSVDFKDDVLEMTDVRPAIYGRHQLENTALVFKATSILKRNGIYVSNEAIRQGIEKTIWPGRFQIITNKYRPTIVLDVAHNVGGMAAFVEAFKIRFPDQKAYFIAGFVKKKNHQKMFDMLSKIARGFTLVPLKTKRSMTPVELVGEVNFKGVSVNKADTVSTAFGRLTKKAGPDDIICIVGSHYLVGEFLGEFGEQWAKIPDRKKIRKDPKVRQNLTGMPRIQS